MKLLKKQYGENRDIVFQGTRLLNTGESASSAARPFYARQTTSVTHKREGHLHIGTTQNEGLMC